jgi:hypothetical protein
MRRCFAPYSRYAGQYWFEDGSAVWCAQRAADWARLPGDMPQPAASGRTLVWIAIAVVAGACGVSPRCRWPRACAAQPPQERQPRKATYLWNPKRHEDAHAP